MAVTTDTRIGSVLAGYRIEALLGRGGMGVVYLAHDASLERKVALKLLAPELSSDDAFRERFLRESRLAASIDHPNVIPIYEAGETEGVLFIAMRYVEGSDFRRLLGEVGRLEPVRAVAMLDQVAEALDVAHEHGLVHRDVKPANVLIASQGGREHVYLADFGLSRRLAAPGALERSHFSGSADYVAPEQVRREPVDGRADLYALACVLYECLTGEPPFRREAVMATLFAHLEDAPPPASHANPDLPPAVDPVLVRGLAKEPDERQPTCRELIDEAREALGIAAPRPSWRRLPRRTKMAVGLVALALAAAAAVPALVLTGGDSRGAPTTTPTYEPTLVPEVDSVQRIDPNTNELVATFPAGDDPVAIAAGEDSVWTASKIDGTVTRVDPTNNAVTIATSADAPTDVVIAGGYLWILEDDTSIDQTDPLTGVVAQTLELKEVEAGPGLLAAGPDSVWGAILCRCGDPNSPESHHGVVEIRLDPDALYSPDSPNVRKIDVSRAGPIDIAVGEGAVWVTSDYAAYAEVMRFDPARGSLAETIRIEDGAAGIAAGEGAVWVANPLGDTVSRIDPATNEVVARIEVGDDPVAVTVGDGSVWVTNYLDGTVSRIDPATNQVVATIEVGRQPNHIAVGEGGVWVTVHSR